MTLSIRPPVVGRRTFLEGLGLGLGATLLSPIAQTLVNEARGEVVPRKIASFWMMGNGIHPAWNFTPPEFMPASDPKLQMPILDGPRDYTWPVMFKALEPYRNRMLLIDGLLFYGFALTNGPRLSAEVLRDFFFYTSGTTAVAAVLLSMRLFAEERQTGTLVLLSTAPVREVVALGSSRGA